MGTLDLNDYLIDQRGKDWSDLLAGWVPPLPECLTVFLVNSFGDVFGTFVDGSIQLLDVGAGAVMKVADDRDDFIRKIDLGNNANNWLMIPLVDQCVSAGMSLDVNQCYGYKIPPMLGGEYKIENFEPTDLSVHYSLMADIYQQVKDLPDGAKVRLVTVRRC